jgi:hypothetical protein
LFFAAEPPRPVSSNHRHEVQARDWRIDPFSSNIPLEKSGLLIVVGQAHGHPRRLRRKMNRILF